MLVLGALVAPLVGAKEVTLSHRGIALNATLEMAEGKSLDDGVVVMVHGTMAHKDMDIMRRFRVMFRQHGFTTLAINLGLGIDHRRGAYDCARPSTHHFADAVTEIGAWLDWLQANGARRMVLFGFSRGGQQSARFAAERDHVRLASLVLLAPINPMEVASSARYESQFGKPLAAVLDRAHSLAKGGNGKAFLENVPFLNCPATDVTAESFLSYYAPDPKLEMPALLEQVKKPTLVVVAGADRIVRDLDKLIAPLAERKRVRVALIPGADHFFGDLYGEDAMDEIVKFLRP